jgi:ribosomal protein S18 acetylase RimI-like enzyme
VAVAIRELGLADESALRALMDAVMPDWSDLLSPVASGPRAFLADGDNSVVAAYVADEPVGWAWGVRIRYPNGRLVTYVHQLDVVERHRRRGIATMLVEASMSIARQRGCSRFWLSTGGHNAAAQALYESLGGDRKPAGDVNFWWEI